MNDSHFKGWARPGQRPQRSETESIQTVPDDESLDALCGFFKIYQLKKGHRFSTDDLLAAWYGTSWCPSADRILDLGSGIGTVAIVAAWRLPGVQVVTVEAQEQSVALAKKSVMWNGLANRFDIRLGDFRESSSIAPAETFDLVLGSPPYFPLDAGLPGDHPQKIACRFEVRGNIDNYCLTASAHLSFGGVFSCVFPINPPFQFKRVQQAAALADLSIVRFRPVILREGDAPLLGLFIMMRQGDLPESFRGNTWEEPALTIRCKDGTVHPEYSAVKLSFGFPP